MQCPRRKPLLLILVASLCLASPMAWAEAGFLVLHVKDVQQHPVANLEIGVEGDGGSGATDLQGQSPHQISATNYGEELGLSAD